MRNSLVKYLQSHSALARLGSLPTLTRASYGSVVVIPACGEAETLPEALQSIRATNPTFNEETLTIVVVNEKAESPEAYRTSNQQTLLLLSKEFPEVLVLNFTGANCFLAKEGVGLARKLGCDLALHYFHAGAIRSPWIHTTDADALVPQSYLHTPLPLPAGLCVYGFHHLPFTDAVKRESLQAYDAFLRYYVDGLSYAGSPYAFPTIGSTFAVHVETYAAIRGFPNREAGEDFYFLNKAAKVGTVTYAKDTEVTLRARVSERVPFGTGKSALKIEALLRSGASYDVYAPETFRELRNWNAAFERFVAEPHSEEWKQFLSGHPFHQEMFTEWQMESLLLRARAQFRASAQLRKFWHDWFDAFRTLKWIHAARRYWPDRPLSRTETYF